MSAMAGGMLGGGGSSEAGFFPQSEPKKGLSSNEATFAALKNIKESRANFPTPPR